MTEILIPCDAIVRLSNVIGSEQAFAKIRLDNGVAVATNRSFMAVEKINDFAGVFYIDVQPSLIEQCRTEAKFNSVLNITINEMLRYAVGKTTLGYVHPSNVINWDMKSPDFDRWREVVAMASKPAPKSVGGMFWDADGIASLTASSPSGFIVFEENIDCNRPTIVRDVHDYSWLGVFNPFSTKHSYQPAVMPSWINV